MSLQDFYDRLDKADWYYQMSDDGSVWRSGERAFGELQDIAKESPEHQALYDSFSKHYYTGPSWGTEQAPKPERPK